MNRGMAGARPGYVPSMNLSDVERSAPRPSEPDHRRHTRFLAAVFQIGGLAVIALGLRATLPIPIISTLSGIALLVISSHLLPAPPSPEDDPLER